MEETVIVEDLVKIYDLGATRVHALRGISFSVKKGEFVTVVGVSGSGKTTLLNILAALDSPTSGEVYVNSIRLKEMREWEKVRYRRETVGMVFQFFNLIPVLSAYENVLLPMMLSGKIKDKKKRAIELLKIVGLGDKIHRYPDELSGGEQQRVAIARALANKPALLLADEPTGNLDSENAKKIVSLLKELTREEGVTIIMVTHDMRMAEMSDRIIFLRDGKIVKDQSYVLYGKH